MTQELQALLIRFGNSTNPFDEHNHMRVVRVDDGEAVVEVTLCRDSLNSWSTPHGGLLFAAADVACGIATVSVRQEQCVTVSASVDFIAAAGSDGTLTAAARVDHAGNKICFCSAEVTDEAGRLIARLRTTMYLTGQPLPRQE